jgi:hypothetical protein
MASCPVIAAPAQEMGSEEERPARPEGRAGFLHTFFAKIQDSPYFLPRKTRVPCLLTLPRIRAGLYFGNLKPFEDENGG